MPIEAATPQPATPTPAAVPPPAAPPARSERVQALLVEKGLAPAGDKPPGETPPGATPPPEGDSKLAKRLAAIANAEARVEEQRKQVEAKEQQLAETKTRAERFAAFEEAKTKEGRLAALRVLFDEGELAEEVYADLTDWVVERAKPMTDEERSKAEEERIDAKIKAKLDEAKKAESDEKTKAAEERRKEVRGGYEAEMSQVFEASPDRWPLISAFGIADGDTPRDPKGPWCPPTTADIHAKIEEHFVATKKATGRGELLTPEQVLDVFETEFRERVEAATNKHAPKVDAQTGKSAPAKQGGSEDPKPSTTVTADWQRDNGTSADAPAGESYEASRDAIKRKYLKS